MWKRVSYLFSLFLTWVLLFLLQKPLFMWCNQRATHPFTYSDVLQVILHGLKLDATMAGYIVVFPFVCILTSVWVNRVNWKIPIQIYLVIVSLLAALAFVVDTALYPFWGFKLDATVLNYIDSPRDAVASVSTWFVLIAVFAWLVLSALIYWAAAVGRLYLFAPIKRLKQRLYGTLCLLLLGGVLFIVIRGGVAESTANVGHAYFSNRLFLNHSAVNPCFSFLASLGKSDKFEDEFNFFAEEKRAQLVKGLYTPQDNTLTDTLLTNTRPNILVIEIESFGGVFVKPIGGIKGVTPQFNRLTKEGVFFTQFYANSFRTDRGTVSTFSGYLAPPTASIMKMPVKSQTLSSLAESLKQLGYATDFVYGGDIDFTNMRSYLLSNGYEHTTGMEDFSLTEQHSNAWGVNDDITFDWLYRQLVKRGDKPWHTGFLTLSSHEPFKVPYHRLTDEKLNSVAYLDDCLGKFIDKLKKSKVWDNLLIICLPDHSMQYKEATPSTERFYHVPMLWLGGAIRQPQQIDKLMNQSDLVATLLAQMQVSHHSFPFSRNVFGRQYTYPFVFSCSNNGFLYKDSTGVSLLDVAANQLIVDSPQGGTVRTDKGKAILQTLYDDLGSR